MTRLESMEGFLQPYLTEWTVNQLGIVKKQGDHEVIRIIGKLLAGALEKQEKSSWLPSSLSTFYLQSSMLTGTCHYLICLSDKLMYLDDDKLETNWVPSYIKLEAEREKIRSELEKEFVRIKAYEVESLLRLCANLYGQMTEIYVKDVYEKISHDLTFGKLHKTMPFSFLYGSYMGELKRVLTID